MRLTSSMRVVFGIEGAEALFVFDGRGCVISFLVLACNAFVLPRIIEKLLIFQVIYHLIYEAFQRRCRVALFH